MFDREFAKEQINAYLTEDLEKILAINDTGKYVPEFFELVRHELKHRGIDPDQIIEKASEKKVEITPVKDEYLANFVSKQLKEKLNIGNLSLEDLVQIYVWESRNPYVIQLVESELIKRGEDPKKYVKPGPIDPGKPAGETQICCSVCGKQLNTGDNFCPNCGNPTSAQEKEQQ